MHSGQTAAKQVRMRHIVRTVSEIGQRQGRQLLFVLPDRLQVRKDLTWVVPVSEPIDHRHASMIGHFLQPLLA